jgi:hypothetical protein
LQNNITGGNTVAFVSEGNSYLFQDGLALGDTLVELVGISASGVKNFTSAGSIWIS